jgi:hypothetical protein
MKKYQKEIIIWESSGIQNNFESNIYNILVSGEE